MKQILVVDDEGGIRELLFEILAEEGYSVILANNAHEARNFRNDSRPDLVLLDIWMPDTDGITLLKEWGARGQLTMPVIMMSGHGTINTAVEATRIGAHAFLEKPFAVRKLLTAVSSALTKSLHLDSRNALLFVGRSPLAQRFRLQIEKLKGNRTSVLILGEPGLQIEEIIKELQLSGEALVEISDFDFTDQWQSKCRQLEAGGVIYLRDVHRFTNQNQEIIRKFLVNKKSKGLRVVSSALERLSDFLAKGEFDSELYRRLAGVQIVAPNLRSRPEDIPELANLILDREAEVRDRNVKGFTTAALNSLRHSLWPGNISQLEVIVKTCFELCSDELIDVKDIVGVLASSPVIPDRPRSIFSFDLALKDAREAFEKMYFEYHLENEKGSISKVSVLTGVDRTHLYRKLKNLGINVSRRSSK